MSVWLIPILYCDQKASRKNPIPFLSLLYSRQPACDAMMFQIVRWRQFSMCRVSLCNSDSKFLISIAPLFVNKNIKCGYVLLVRTFLSVLKIFVSLIYLWHCHVRKLFGYGMWEKETIIRVQCLPINPNHRVHHSNKQCHQTVERPEPDQVPRTRQPWT